MIDQYDQLQQNVKLHQAVLKGKAKPTQKLASLGMRVIIEKNKQIKHAKKQHLSRVIVARKLKIKISQIFKINNLSNSFAALSHKQKKDKNLKTTNVLMVKTAKTDSLKRRTLSVNTLLSDRKMQNTSYSIFLPQTALKHKNVQQDNGRINLFDNFTDEQLDRIEEDEVYYFAQSDLIAVFRKYMLRKRQNNKDFTYQKFSIKPHQTYYKFTYDKNLDKRQFILNSLKIDGGKKTDNNQLHLLTNPIQLTQPNQKLRSKSLSQLRKSKRNLFEMLKDKQVDNMQKIIRQRKKKILNIRIQRNYIDGVAAEIRAVHKDKKNEKITKKNKYQEQKSMACRMRVKTLRENLGKSIELAQRIRSQFLKRRTANNRQV